MPVKEIDSYGLVDSINHDNVSDIVVQKLKDYILNNEMKSGDKLPSEPQLAETLHISRSSIREAMKSLEGLGIIETRHGKGRFIRDFNYDQMLDSLSYNLNVHFKDFYEVAGVRIALETSFLPLAAERYTDEDLDNLQSILNRLEKEIRSGKSEQELVLTHTLFHRRLYKVLDNRLLDSLISMFASFQRLMASMNKYSTSDNEEFLEKHKKLLASLRTRDKVKILESFNDHFSDIRDPDNER